MGCPALSRPRSPAAESCARDLGRCLGAAHRCAAVRAGLFNVKLPDLERAALEPDESLSRARAENFSPDDESDELLSNLMTSQIEPDDSLSSVLPDDFR